jgi:pimeloyl-ACP methyl ester carboxylesterase
MNPVRIAVVLSVCALQTPCQAALAPTFQDKCEAMAKGAVAGTITTAKFIPAGPLNLPGPPPISLGAPDHCQIQGALAPHVGIDGKPYAIGYELRLPANWNGKFVFQGGGGSDGVLRPAIGVQATGEISALAKGYAIASTDAGHRDEPGPIGPYLFGLDPQARIDKGYNHIPVVTAQAEELIRTLYGKPRSRAYFVGCSNGGRQGMAATQRYPHLFDGVIAGAPAYRVPLAAIEAIAGVQTFAAVAPKGADGKPDLGAAVSTDDLKLVATKITELCDAADGLADGLVNNVKACKFDPLALACPAGQTAGCLAPERAKAIDRVFKGARLANGEVFYSDWPYDPGIASPGWTAWKIGNPGKVPPDARNVSLIPGSVAYYFSTPPEKVTDLYDYTLKFDLDRGIKAVGAVSPPFLESGGSVEAASSTDIAAFRAHGGKIIFYHGLADPIFSANDTVAYVDALTKRLGSADDFTRLYLVPGMNHCSGGPATDQFDALTALDDWVDKGQAPQSLLAKARNVPGVPWPGRTRPLCPYPAYASYAGGNAEDAASFACR